VRLVPGREDSQDEPCVLVARPPAVFFIGLPREFELGLPQGVDADHAFRALCELNGLDLERKGPLAWVARARDPSQVIEPIIDIASGRRAPPGCGIDLGSPDGYGEALLAFGGARALLAIIQGYAARWPSLGNNDEGTRERAFVLAVEEFAAGPSDARVNAALEDLARTSDLRQRFHALYALEELREPSYPAPPEDDRGGAPLELARDASLEDVVAAVASATRCQIELAEGAEASYDRPQIGRPPWATLIELSQHMVFREAGGPARITRTGRTVRLEPIERDPQKSKFDALARDPRVPEALAKSIEYDPLYAVKDFGKGIRALSTLADSDVQTDENGEPHFVPRRR
jgi:hypothetical protein